jgi:hypothetical protein
MIFSVLLLVEPCVAPVTVPANPSPAPEIVSVTINSAHYWRPPTYTTNPYTGETKEIEPGHYVPNGTVEIIIKNRPFTPYTDKAGNTINVYYTIFAIGLKVTSWDYMLNLGPIPWYSVYQSDGDYTVITATYFAGLAQKPHLTPSYEGTIISFRVQAVAGYFIQNDVEVYDHNAIFEGEGSEPAFFEITIPVTTGKPKPTTTIVKPSNSIGGGGLLTSNPYNTPSSQNLLLSTLFVVVLVCVCVILVLVVVIVCLLYRQRKRKRKYVDVVVEGNVGYEGDG